nr:integumentary mucin A.1-like [Penaeus vannamei]
MATMQMFGRTGNKKTGIILAVIGGLMFAIGIALVITGAALPCSFDEDDWDYDCNSKLPLFITGGFMLPFALIILGLGLTIICYIRHASLITSVSTRTDMHISHQYGTTTVSAQRTVGNSPYPQQAAVPPYPQQEAAPPYSQQAAVPPYPQQEAAPPYSQQAAVPPYHSRIRSVIPTAGNSSNISTAGSSSTIPTTSSSSTIPTAGTNSTIPTAGPRSPTRTRPKISPILKRVHIKSLHNELTLSTHHG